MHFNIHSKYQPAGDQPEAIRLLTEGILRNEKSQVLLGVTGSGKTFTIANLIENVQKPTLVLSHNKTLVAQLYGEFKEFFPENRVEYFVSYYDYYQPEAYLPVTDTYIEKDLSINAEIEKLRLSATSALMSGRRDVIVVASVSCIYGLGNPAEFKNRIIRLSVGTPFCFSWLITYMLGQRWISNVEILGLLGIMWRFFYHMRIMVIELRFGEMRLRSWNLLILSQINGWSG